MAGKKHYFGVGGGTRQFVNLVEEDGELCFVQTVNFSMFLHSFILLSFSSLPQSSKSFHS